MRSFSIIALLLFLLIGNVYSAYLFIPMSKDQKNHLKAYGVAYGVLEKGIYVDWLLNYEGGSFLIPYASPVESELKLRGITYQVFSDAQVNQLLDQLKNPVSNMDAVRLEKAPSIAVYSPKSKQPWDDAVTLALTYAEIPYDVIFDEEVLTDKLPTYDWLHLHHEDFTGQYGKFYSSNRYSAWYIDQQREAEELARQYHFSKVSQLKLAVVKKIRDYCAGGGFLFAMCSATDTYDIALAADGVDICAEMYDGDAADSHASSKLDFSNTFAFQQFQLEMNPYVYEYSDIDNNPVDRPGVTESNDYFTLFQFSAKWDPIPTMLTQNHEYVVKGFMGQTTAFKSKLVKPTVVVMGENRSIGEAKYLHGVLGKGFWTFYGGHDPEDYQHMVGEEPTDMSLYPNSPGYRLILNNILFPAAKKKKMKT